MRVFQDIELEGIELNLREGWTTIQPGRGQYGGALSSAEGKEAGTTCSFRRFAALAILTG